MKHLNGMSARVELASRHLYNGTCFDNGDSALHHEHFHLQSSSKKARDPRSNPVQQSRGAGD
ncbi:MAG: hypothetical protein AB7V13_03990 [Pseudorhodoplanes sp.]